MNIIEAIKSGKKFIRKIWLSSDSKLKNYWFMVKMIDIAICGTPVSRFVREDFNTGNNIYNIAFDPADVIADDWEVKED